MLRKYRPRVVPWSVIERILRAEKGTIYSHSHKFLKHRMHRIRADHLPTDPLPRSSFCLVSDMTGTFHEKRHPTAGDIRRTILTEIDRPKIVNSVIPSLAPRNIPNIFKISASASTILRERSTRPCGLSARDVCFGGSGLVWLRATGRHLSLVPIFHLRSRRKTESERNEASGHCTSEDSSG
jgi:hypothetical protein